MGCSVLVSLLITYLCLARGTDVLNVMIISSGGGQYDTSGAEPAIDLAVEVINNNTILPGYTLNIASRGNSSVSEDY